jgi:hypothetical protein
MGDSKGSSNEDIGRPGPWSEGRYQEPGKPVDESVVKEPRSEREDEPASTPVTRKDYE